MTNTLTTDTEASVAQIDRIAAAGGRIRRLTTPNEKDAERIYVSIGDKVQCRQLLGIPLRQRRRLVRVHQC